jgi:hypothetical protein
MIRAAFRRKTLSEWLPSLCSTKRVIAQAKPKPESRRGGGHLCHRRFTVEANQFRVAFGDLGYTVEQTGQSQRIFPHAITERFETTSSGALVTATENSTKPVTTRVTHAGIAIVDQFNLRLP